MIENCDCSIHEAKYSLNTCTKKNKFKFTTFVDYLEVIDSENVCLRVTKKDCQIRRDIEVKVKCYNRIYGTVYSDCKAPVENAVVNLIKYEPCAGSLDRQVIAYSVTDEFGTFSFLVQKDENIDRYKIEIDGLLS
ncbi:MAG: hypothetical protein ACRC28_13845 [Clostridium sp.]|uniref:hypothetical protein n=1 Tax=Clostridium sp. TaxID=1506 RepID=UPI003F35ED77